MDYEPPKNLVSEKAYRGINVFLLASNGYGSPYWLTYKQATERGGHVRKGEHGTKLSSGRSARAKPKTRTETPSSGNPFFSAITPCSTWSNARVSLLPRPPANESNRGMRAHRCQMPNPPAMEQDDRAWYRPSTDTVGMPSRNAFDSAEEYYSTLFHELTHSTGHT